MSLSSSNYPYFNAMVKINLKITVVCTKVKTNKEGVLIVPTTRCFKLIVHSFTYYAMYVCIGYVFVRVSELRQPIFFIVLTTRNLNHF